MAFSKQLLALCFALFAVSVNAAIGLGRCPPFETVQNFQADKYDGLWYEYARYQNILESGSKCNTATYNTTTNGTISVLYRQVNALFGNKQTFEGSAKEVAPGKLIVEFSNILTHPKSPYWILDTDYENYSVVWSCQDAGLIREDALWVLTRSPFPSTEHLGKAITALLERGLSTDKLHITNHNDC